MKKNAISIISFILCFSLFVILRVYAGKEPTKAVTISDTFSVSESSASTNSNEPQSYNESESNAVSNSTTTADSSVESDSSNAPVSHEADASSSSDAQNEPRKPGLFTRISSSLSSAWISTVTYISDSISSIKEAVAFEDSTNTNINDNNTPNELSPDVTSSSIAVDNSLTNIDSSDQENKISGSSLDKNTSTSLSALDNNKTIDDLSGKYTDKLEEDADENDSNDDYQGFLEDIWHGDFTPQKKFKGDLPRIICWGDSLTETLDNKTAYPDILRTLTDCEVINYGVSSETTKMIAMRAGGIKLSVTASVIPSTCDMIPIFIESEDNDSIFLLDYGDAGINNCSIAGIEGTLRKINGSYYFTRSEEGERKSLDDGAPFETFAHKDASDNDVIILFTGTNDKPDPQTIYDIIDIQRSILNAANCSKYIVVGLTYNDGIKDIDAVNAILSNEYGDNFLDLRTYLMDCGLEDANIHPTSTDMIDISKGDIPSSLMRDYVHGNQHYHRLLANQIYRRMMYLGYLPYNN